MSPDSKTADYILYSLETQIPDEYRSANTILNDE